MTDEARSLQRQAYLRRRRRRRTAVLLWRIGLLLALLTGWELAGDTLVMHRRGGSELHARFRTGEAGEFRIGLMEQSGRIPLDTQICTARRTSDGWRVALKYCLRFEGEVRIFRLNIAVNIISEEQ